jgi:hypothetical protein
VKLPTTLVLGFVSALKASAGIDSFSSISICPWPRSRAMSSLSLPLNCRICRWRPAFAAHFRRLPMKIWYFFLDLVGTMLHGRPSVS